jgi:hypothetical protein
LLNDGLDDELFEDAEDADAEIGLDWLANCEEDVALIELELDAELLEGVERAKAEVGLDWVDDEIVEDAEDVPDVLDTVFTGEDEVGIAVDVEFEGDIVEEKLSVAKGKEVDSVLDEMLEEMPDAVPPAVEEVGGDANVEFDAETLELELLDVGMFDGEDGERALDEVLFVGLEDMDGGLVPAADDADNDAAAEFDGEVLEVELIGTGIVNGEDGERTADEPLLGGLEEEPSGVVPRVDEADDDELKAEEDEAVPLKVETNGETLAADVELYWALVLVAVMGEELVAGEEVEEEEEVAGSVAGLVMSTEPDVDCDELLEMLDESGPPMLELELDVAGEEELEVLEVIGLPLLKLELLEGEMLGLFPEKTDELDSEMPMAK